MEQTMPQDHTGHSMDQPATQAVVVELWTPIRDVRVRLDAIPMPVEPARAVIVPSAYWETPAPTDAGSSEAHEVPRPAELDVASTALGADAATLSLSAEHAADAVRTHGDEIDAILAEIRRVTAETAAA
jgi:hypothetical protein